MTVSYETFFNHFARLLTFLGALCRPPSVFRTLIVVVQIDVSIQCQGIDVPPPRSSLLVLLSLCALLIYSEGIVQLSILLPLLIKLS